jgi:hypothetical protein
MHKALKGEINNPAMIFVFFSMDVSSKRYLAIAEFCWDLRKQRAELHFIMAKQWRKNGCYWLEKK